MHTPTFTLWNKEWCQEWPQQEVAQGLDQQYKTLWGLCSSLWGFEQSYTVKFTLWVLKEYFSGSLVFSISETQRERERERNWLHSWEIKMGGDEISAGKIVLCTWIHSAGRIWGSSPAISSPNSKNCCTLLDLVNVIGCTIGTLMDILGSLIISALFKDHS